MKKYNILVLLLPSFGIHHTVANNGCQLMPHSIQFLQFLDEFRLLVAWRLSNLGFQLIDFKNEQGILPVI